MQQELDWATTMERFERALLIARTERLDEVYRDLDRATETATVTAQHEQAPSTAS